MNSGSANDATRTPTRVAVQVLFYSTIVRPEEITTRLMLSPTTTAEMGIKRGKRTGTEVHVPRHMWQLSSESYVSERDVARHLDCLLSRLYAVHDEFRKLCSTGDTQAELVAVIWASGTSLQVKLSIGLLEMLLALGLELRLEFADYGNDD